MWFDSLYRNYFLSKTQQSLTYAEYVLLFSVFHDVKRDTSMTCEELFDSVYLYSTEKVETRNFNFYLKNKSMRMSSNVFNRRYFLKYFFREADIIYDRIICSYTISFLSEDAPIFFVFSFL